MRLTVSCRAVARLIPTSTQIRRPLSLFPLFGGRAFGGASSQQLAVVLPGRKLCTGHADAVLVLFLHRVRSALVSPFRCVFSPAAVVTTLRVLSALVSPFRGFRFSFGCTSHLTIRAGEQESGPTVNLSP
jgi:hypothetical protein